ncbi:MAG: N-acetylglucosamine-6-phosphate deacetylase [Clostridia bacterium]|nr:N-acetylglucosamine-6-phosphate deacetylase [Clostridia bacterium]
MKALINGRIIFKDRIEEGLSLVIGDKIEAVVKAGSEPKGCEIIDCKGSYIAPGLIDLHIHGYLGKDECDGDEESMRIIAGGIIKNGVTGFLPTTMTVSMDVIEKAITVCGKLMEESKTWNGTQILGVHAEGPFINPSKKGAQNEAFIKKPDYEFVKKYADIIKIITLAPEMDPDFTEITKIRKNTDVVVSMGHTDADYETALASTRCGVRHATHLYNAMSGPNSRKPGVVTAALNSDVTCEMIVDTFHVNPANYKMVYKMKGRKLCFITDCLPAGGLPEGEYTLGGQKFISKGIECRLPDGTIAGSVLKLNKGIMNFYKNTDVPLWECVNCASLNPAAAIGIDRYKGSIEPGKDADIIILDDEFNVLKTIIGGEIRYEA